AVVLVYLPGRAVLARCRLELAPLEHLCLAVALGIPASSLAYWLAAYLGARWGLRVSPSGLLARVRYPHALLLLVVLLATAPLSVAPLLFRNLARVPGGGVTFHSVADPVLHLSIANE